MKAFSCPQCGASLEGVQISGATVGCPYCRSVVVVPPDLRPAPPGAGSGGPRRRPVWPLVAVTVALVLALAFFLSRGKEQPRAEATRPAPTAFAPTRPSPQPSPTPDPGYTVALTFGGEGTGDGLFQDSMRVAVGADGSIYVSDETFRVQKFTPEGKLSTVFLIPRETRWYRKAKHWPRRLLVDRAGLLYALVGGVALKLDGATGEVLGAVDVPGYVLDAALTADGGLLLVASDGQSDDLVRLDPRGRTVKRAPRFVTSVADKQLLPDGLRVAADGAGNVFAVYGFGGLSGTFSYDSEDLAVYRFTSELRYVSKFGSAGRAPGQFGDPAGIAVDNRGRVLVYESATGPIQLFTPDGRLLDRFPAPFWLDSLAVDADNNLYAAGNHKVLKLVPTR